MAWDPAPGLRSVLVPLPVPPLSVRGSHPTPSQRLKGVSNTKVLSNKKNVIFFIRLMTKASKHCRFFKHHHTITVSERYRLYLGSPDREQIRPDECIQIL